MHNPIDLRQMPMNPHTIKVMVDALIMEYPELAEDEQLLADTIEGETNVHEMLERLLSKVRSAECMQEAIASRIEQLKQRKNAFELREQYTRKLMHRIMDAAGQRKAVLTEGTLSVRATPPAVVITNQEAIPDEFMRHPPPEPDRTRIKAAIKAGEHVPGCELSNAADTMAILNR